MSIYLRHPSAYTDWSVSVADFAYQRINREDIYPPAGDIEVELVSDDVSIATAHAVGQTEAGTGKSGWSLGTRGVTAGSCNTTLTLRRTDTGASETYSRALTAEWGTPRFTDIPNVPTFKQFLTYAFTVSVAGASGSSISVVSSNPAVASVRIVEVLAYGVSFEVTGKTPGNYTLTYRASNPTGASISATRTSAITASAPRIFGLEDKVFGVGQTISFDITFLGAPTLVTIAGTTKVTAALSGSGSEKRTVTLTGVSESSGAGETITVTAKNAVGTTTDTFSAGVLLPPDLSGLPKTVTVEAGATVENDFSFSGDPVHWLIRSLAPGIAVGEIVTVEGEVLYILKIGDDTLHIGSDRLVMVG